MNEGYSCAKAEMHDDVVGSELLRITAAILFVDGSRAGNAGWRDRYCCLTQAVDEDEDVDDDDDDEEEEEDDDDEEEEDEGYEEEVAGEAEATGFGVSELNW